MAPKLWKLPAVLRLPLAALFTCCVPIVALMGIEALTGGKASEAVAWLALPLFPGAFYVAYLLFSRPEDRMSFRGQDPEAEVRRLRELGLLVESECRVRRLFEIEGGHDGPQYVCELDDSSCLLLRGQFLWDYERPPGWPWPQRTTWFPCTRFVLQQAKGRPGSVIHLVCLGEPLEPEAVAAPISEQELDAIWEHFDVAEVTRSARPYEELKRLFLHERPLRSSDDSSD